MKKLLAILLALVMLMGVFAACTPKNPGPVSSDNIIDSSDEDDISSEEEDDISSEEEEEEDYDEDEYLGGDEGGNNNDDPYADLSPVEIRAKNIEDGVDTEFLQAALTKDKSGKVVANNYRLKQFIKKMRAAQDINVVYFGGQNVGVDGGFTDRFTSWLDNECDGWINSYEASFPGINSEDAAYRVKHDVIDQDPDLVFLDFAVQDNFASGAKNRAAAFENIVRRILAETDAAVVVISSPAAEVNSYRQNNTNPDPMVTAGDYHKAIAEYYGVPFIDYFNAAWDVVALLVDKRPYGQVPLCNWPFFAITATDLSDTGHRNLAAMMQALIIDVEKETVTDKKVDHKATINNVNTYLHKNNSYMKYDYMDVMDLYYSTKGGIGKADKNAGYAIINHEGASLAQWSKAADYNGTSQFFQAFRPLLTPGDAVNKISAPIIIDMPEVTKENKAYLHVAFEQTTGGTQTIPWSLYRVTCYDKNGKIIGGEGSRTLSTPKHAETPTNYSYFGTKIELKEGTVKVMFEIYASSGYIRLYGIGRTQTMQNKIAVNY